VSRGHDLHVDTPPLYGFVQFRLWLWEVPAVAIGALGVVYLPKFAASVPWRHLLVASFVIAGGWAAALAGVRKGWGLIDNPSSRRDYLQSVPRVGSPRQFLAHYAHDLARYTDHVHGHPPGMVVLLWFMNHIGLHGPRWDTALLLSAFGATVVAVLVAMREVAGEELARAAMPFLVIAPFAAQGVAITADALYAALSAWGITCVMLATGRKGRRADMLAFVGGLVFGCALYGSYGVFVLAVIPVVVAYSRRTLRPLIVAGAGIAVVGAIFVAFGFWWVSGLLATRALVAQGADKNRPATYFVFADLAIFALVLGPAIAVALARLRDRSAWLLVGGALGAVAIADASQLSRAEVERIWLPMAFWVTLSACAFGKAAMAKRPWLALNVVVALALVFTIRSIW
jgi:methylthioxylose transferase